jgi:hypothetical protein
MADRNGGSVSGAIGGLMAVLCSGFSGLGAGLCSLLGGTIGGMVMDQFAKAARDNACVSFTIDPFRINSTPLIQTDSGDHCKDG